jgi:hypothetical protein
MKYTVLLDFDGVIHSYEKGWTGIDDIPSPPVAGAMDTLKVYTEQHDFDVCIYSSRSKDEAGLMAVKKWILKFLIECFGPEVADRIMSKLSFPTQKPGAWLTIDDRAFCFKGEFPDPTAIRNFRPWNRVK